MEFWKRHAGRKPWIFRDRFQLAYLFEPGMAVAQYYHQRSVLADAALAAFLERHIKPGQTMVDVRSGMGGTVLLAARLMKGEGAVFAMEPDPAAYRLLLNNITLNGFTQMIRAIGRPVTGPAGAGNILKLDALAESWNLAKIHLLCLPSSDDIAATIQGAKDLISKGQIERILCLGTPEKLREIAVLKALTTGGYVFHDCAVDGVLKPLGDGARPSGNLLAAVHREAGCGG